MSSEAVVSIKNLSKAYATYLRPEDRLKQALIGRVHRAMTPLLKSLGISWASPAYYELNWALRPFTLDILRGETVAVIGRNGSGKSTLLQLICGTATPTTGEVHTGTRIGALLELGSGFNPEFTGRENIYMNASVLGLSKKKTDERMQDIIAFAEISEFIDRPVKTYSSGMTMRLAFSVIANVDCELLVVDEALAVGDAYFQQKCMRWIRQFQNNGTVLFCSHDVGAVLSLCNRAVWLDEGNVKAIGSAKEVCEAYNAFIHRLSTGQAESEIRAVKSARVVQSSAEPDQNKAFVRVTNKEMPQAPSRGLSVFDTLSSSEGFGTGMAEILRAKLTAADGNELYQISGGEQVELSIYARAKSALDSVMLGFIVKDRLGQPIFGDNTLERAAGRTFTVKENEFILAKFAFELPILAAGRYSITLAFATGTIEDHVHHHWLHDGLTFDVRSMVGGVMFALPGSTSSVEVRTGEF